MEKYIGFIYIWENVDNNKKYIGSHCGSIDDGYIGSGIYFRRAYDLSPSSFKRTILEFIYKKEDQFIIEQKYLNELITEETKESFYNISKVAGGGKLHDHLSNEEKLMIYKKANAASLSRLKSMTEIEKEELANKKRKSWNRNGKKESHSKNTSIRRIAEEKSKSIEDKLKFKETCKRAYNNRSKEELESISNRVKKKTKSFWEDPSNDGINSRRIEKMRNTRKSKKLKYINKDNTMRQVPEVELASWLNQGWSLGMGTRRRSNS